MQKTNVLRKNDFEKYEVLLPFSAALGKRRKQYLYSELEKMHPCFSDEFCFDAAVRKIGKKGISADVLVMSKRKLAEYEGKRKLSGTGFFVEKLKHRFFVNSRFRLTGLGVITCVLIGLTGLSCGKAFAGIEGKVSLTDEFSTSENIPVSAPEISAAADSSVCYLFFDVLKESDGRISFFEWKLDGFTEKLSARLRGIYPEDLTALKDFTARTQTEEFVSYENGLPLMKVFYSQKLSSFKRNEEKSSNDILTDKNLENADFNKKLRKTILLNNAVLTEEKAPPYHITFTCSFDTENKKLFKEIADIITLEKRKIIEVTVDCSGDGKTCVGITIEPEQQKVITGFDLSLLYENLNFFEIKNNKKTPDRSTAVKKKASDPVQVQNKLNRKIGEIKSADNTTIVFYKNEKGKIERLVQKNQ